MAGGWRPRFWRGKSPERLVCPRSNRYNLIFITFKNIFNRLTNSKIFRAQMAEFTPDNCPTAVGRRYEFPELTANQS